MIAKKREENNRFFTPYISDMIDSKKKNKKSKIYQKNNDKNPLNIAKDFMITTSKNIKVESIFVFRKDKIFVKSFEIIYDGKIYKVITTHSPSS